MKYSVNKNDEISIWSLVAKVSLLVLVVLIIFLIIKYIVNDNIGWEKPPVDVSERF